MSTQHPAFEFLIPHNTGPTQLTTDRYFVPLPRLNQVEIFFPGGQDGQVYFQMRTPSWGILIPGAGSNVAFHRGDSNTLEMQPRIKLDGFPYIILVAGYNLDTTFDHTVFIRFGVDP